MKYYIGIDLGGTNIVAAVVDENYKILTKASTIDRSGIAHIFELPGNGISAADGRFINLGYDVFFTCTRI